MPALPRVLTTGLQEPTSPIRLTAMTDAENLDSAAVGADEEEAVVTNTQPKFFSALESFHIARARFRETMQRRENMHRGGLAQVTDIGPSWAGPNDPPHFG
jgi:hypothetical protein